MRLGGHVFGDCSDPDAWIAEVQRLGYRAAYVPKEAYDGDKNLAQAYARAAEEADIVIAEVGAWSNPLSPDQETREGAVELCKSRLALADEIGARCCVNISGSRGNRWDGPHPDNLTDETFELVVEMVRDIIDSVEPSRTFYTLEAMPWMYPDSPDSYLGLIAAVDRHQFAVHLDPVNLIYSPQRFFANAALIRECFAKLGPHIKSCHAKDIALSDDLTVHLDEVRPGLGGLDYRTFLGELDRLEPDTPLMLEHLPDEREYVLAAEHIQSVAAGLEVSS